MWFGRERPQEADDVAALSATLDELDQQRPVELSPPKTSAEKWLVNHTHQVADDEATQW